MKIIYTVCLFMTTLILSAQDTDSTDQKWSAGRPDGHAPISVMADHIHKKGEWMFSYRYMHMNMEDLKQGSDDASFADALANYRVTPTQMPMDMHMVGTMYAISDNITLTAMFNYISKKMDHVTRMGGTFRTEASGFGDIKIGALYQFFNKNRQTLHGQIGISIPTGSVTEGDVTPASAPNATVLPYPMQIGSGTLDPILGITYLGQNNLLSWGSQLQSTFRFGENERDFRYGNRYSWNNWLGIKALSWLSFSARVEGLIVEGIQGIDPNLIPTMVITADTANSGGTYINSGIGFNTYLPNGALKNLRFGFEFGYPIYQDLNGIQLKNKENFTIGAQYSF
ncbi:transporter family protein [Spongiimicrobium salis]|uniref:transporter n=1 Tax=Spongiimicrobium salis TaxID=1667022 RepID=UPI00374D5AA5